MNFSDELNISKNANLLRMLLCTQERNCIETMFQLTKNESSGKKLRNWLWSLYEEDRRESKLQYNYISIAISIYCNFYAELCCFFYIQLVVKCITSKQDQQRKAKSCHIDQTSGHLGIKWTVYRISERFHWNGIIKDVKQVVCYNLAWLNFFASLKLFALVHCRCQLVTCASE